MISLFLTAAAVLIVLGAGLLYLASPNQRLYAAALPLRLLALTGMLLLLVALLLLLQFSGSATSVFILLTGVMLMWTVPPMVIGYLRHKRGGETS